jgi:hypothetical protein
MVTWNGWGRPSARSASASPSRTTASTDSREVASTISGTRVVTSARFRVNARTSAPSRWTCSRAPSSFHSTDAGRIRSNASPIASALWASIGWSGDRTWSRKRDRPAGPSASAAAATGPRSPPTISARRTDEAGTSAARETASTITPSSAPWRISPVRSPRRNRCSDSVARPNSSSTARRRATCEPGPRVAPTLRRAASTSRTLRVGVDAGDGTSRSDAHPTPIGSWGSTPDR